MSTLRQEDFPPLNNQQQPNYLNQIFFKCFLVLKNKNEPDTKVANVDPWDMEHALIESFGKKSFVKAVPLRSGNILLEVDKEIIFPF